MIYDVFFANIYLFKDYNFKRINEVFKVELYLLNKKEKYSKDLKNEIENIDFIIKRYENFLNSKLNKIQSNINWNCYIFYIKQNIFEKKKKESIFIK